jgi:hypothetical protein
MYVTNLRNAKLGINGVINLAPREVNRYIDDEDLDLVARVVRLEAANLVSVVREEGITKTGITGKIVKTMGADTSALTQAPRTGGAKPPVAPAPPVQKEEEEIKPPAAEVAPEDPKDEDLKDEDPKDEQAEGEDKVEDVVEPTKPAKRSSRKAKVIEAIEKASQ